MTQNQRTQLRKVINNLYNVQVTLNAIMYLEPIADIEYEQIRDSFLQICDVTEQLNNV